MSEYSSGTVASHTEEPKALAPLDTPLGVIFEALVRLIMTSSEEAGLLSSMVLEEVPVYVTAFRVVVKPLGRQLMEKRHKVRVS
jgi:hypothetical protein